MSVQISVKNVAPLTVTKGERAWKVFKSVLGAHSEAIFGEELVKALWGRVEGGLQ